MMSKWSLFFYLLQIRCLNGFSFLKSWLYPKAWKNNKAKKDKYPFNKTSPLYKSDVNAFKITHRD